MDAPPDGGTGVAPGQRRVRRARPVAPRRHPVASAGSRAPARCRRARGRPHRTRARSRSGSRGTLAVPARGASTPVTAAAMIAFHRRWARSSGGAARSVPPRRRARAKPPSTRASIPPTGRAGAMSHRDRPPIDTDGVEHRQPALVADPGDEQVRVLGTGKYTAMNWSGHRDVPADLERPGDDRLAEMRRRRPERRRGDREPRLERLRRRRASPGSPARRTRPDEQAAVGLDPLSVLLVSLPSNGLALALLTRRSPTSRSAAPRAEIASSALADGPVDPLPDPDRWSSSSCRSPRPRTGGPARRHERSAAGATPRPRPGGCRRRRRRVPGCVPGAPSSARSAHCAAPRSCVRRRHSTPSTQVRRRVGDVVELAPQDRRRGAPSRRTRTRTAR